MRGLLAYSLDEDFNIGGAFDNLCYPQVLSNLNRIIASNPNFYDFTCPEDRPTMISPIGEVVNNDSGQPGWSGAPPLCVNMDGCNKDDLNDYLDVVTLNLVGLIDADADLSNLSSVGNHYIPTTTCDDALYFGFFEPVLICLDPTPNCADIKIADVKLGDDDPFEVAISNDGCSGDTVPETTNATERESLLSLYANLDGADSDVNPFCVPYDTEVEVSYTDKAFDKAAYCSKNAKKSRNGRCKN